MRDVHILKGYQGNCLASQSELRFPFLYKKKEELMVPCLSGGGKINLLVVAGGAWHRPSLSLSCDCDSGISYPHLKDENQECFREDTMPVLCL